ncbi:unnamed protein product [Paramecium sonneborni]|uniref:Uncharacterized protein n=1 Tax=Paramecium sonneborni TaxID=65129 RepID=A0A8S1KM87_9CILI|nr:unnamed protein product [Paramecium sonneborni]
MIIKIRKKGRQLNIQREQNEMIIMIVNKLDRNKINKDREFDSVNFK